MHGSASLEHAWPAPPFFHAFLSGRRPFSAARQGGRPHAAVAAQPAAALPAAQPAAAAAAAQPLAAAAAARRAAAQPVPASEREPRRRALFALPLCSRFSALE